MSVFTRTTALASAGTLLAVPAAFLIASPASADVDRRGDCGKGVYELSVDREDGGYEVSVDLDRVKPGSKWNVVLRHDNKQFYNRTLTADREGDVEVERFRNNTAGKDSFKFRATRVNGNAACGAGITLS